MWVRAVSYTHLDVYKRQEKYSISREDQDKWALRSQQRAAKAIEEGVFKDEIVPVHVKRRKEEFDFDTDEHVRPGTTLEKLAKLRPAFKADGTVTAGNASGMNDGAAAVVMMSEDKAKELGLVPKLRIVAQACGGVDPSVMGTGPLVSTRKCLERAGMTLEEIDEIELNEAFAAQTLACIRELGMDESKVNIHGSGISIGHPIGCTGAMLTVKLLYSMPKTGARYGLSLIHILQHLRTSAGCPDRSLLRTEEKAVSYTHLKAVIKTQAANDSLTDIPDKIVPFGAVQTANQRDAAYGSCLLYTSRCV